MNNDLPSVGTEDALVISVDLQLITGFIFDPRPKSAIQRAAEIIEKLVSERDELTSRVSELEAEVLDQCRLNGMGAERESALMGRVRELTKQNEAQKDEWLSWNEKRAALEQNASRWREFSTGKAFTVKCRKATVIYGPNLEADFPQALAKTIDAALNASKEQP